MRPTLLLYISFSCFSLAACGEVPQRATGGLRELEPPRAPDFEHRFTVDTTFHVVESVSSGVALFDADLDDSIDVLAVDGAGGRPRLFLQRDSAFAPIDTVPGFEPLTYGGGAAVGDFDNDGRPDVFLTSPGSAALYRNTTTGFRDVTSDAGIQNPSWGTSGAWFDFDRDGWLDLYVVNYLDIRSPVRCTDRAGAAEYCGPTAYPPARDRLFRNRGDGTFDDVTSTSGIAALAGRGLGIGVFDFDRDGWPDVYVANDGEPNFLWHNQRDGTFTERALALGAAVNGQGRAEAGMGVAIGDLDSDGFPDVYVTHLSGESNTFYRNDQGRTFVDETEERGLHAASLPFTGFGTALLDLENDGDLDIIVANGRINRGPLVAGAPPGFLQAYSEPNTVYVNDGEGRFHDATTEFPDIAARPGMSRGLAVGDLDGDGGVDVVVSETGRELRVFRNELDRGHWIGFDVVEPRYGGRHAIGAELELWSGPRGRYAWVSPNSSYLSSNDPRVHVGLGSEAGIDSVIVTWPDGVRETFKDLTSDRYHRIRRGDGATR